MMEHRQVGRSGHESDEITGYDQEGNQERFKPSMFSLVNGNGISEDGEKIPVNMHLGVSDSNEELIRKIFSQRRSFARDR